ncbi:YfiR family protein, partial [Fulvivirga kasyanovii]|uniref:YfiR family protein n=1 Tax=Fulvivirga kasyanovii TaxID=396812 RepID=UPI0031DA746B
KARNNSNISVRKIDLSATNQCDVVFLPTSQNSKFNPLLESAKNSSILIITEDGGLIRKGAGISFLKEGESISFVVNKASLDKRRLQMTGALLSLGKQI